MSDTRIPQALRCRCRANARAAAFLITTAALTACGGGGSSDMSSSNTPTMGTSSATSVGGAVVTLTDAPGDFQNYIVNVTALQLTRSDGTVVQALPVTTQVDFAQLVNLSEIVSTSQIPAGKYVSASLTLDYSAATIVVEGGSGSVTIAAGNIIDGATSLPLVAPNPTTMTVTLTLPSNAPLVITQGSVANLALDFNLAASDAITPSTAAPTTVTVNPVLTASLATDTTKQVHVRGGLVSTNATAGSFVISVMPFCNQSGQNGQFTVLTSAATTFTINGTGYTEAAGLAQLATTTAGTVTAAYGSLDRTTMTFTATSVLVGSSVAGTRLDSVSGTVTSRTGDTLTIGNGLAYSANAGGMSYAHLVTATIGAATSVSEPGQSGTFTVQDISVGQHLQLSGTLGTGATGRTLDATAGGALLSTTTLSGTVTANAANLVTVNLQSLDGQSPSNLNFAGTGTATAQDALATAYTVSLPAALSTAGAGVGVPVRFTGFVAPFGTAPPDFNALSLISYANTKADLAVRWTLPGVAAPFATLTAGELLISQATLTASAEHVLRISFDQIDPSTLAAGLQLVPDAAAANPQYAIQHFSSWKADAYTTFAAFVTALTGDLNGTTDAVAVEAAGPYDATTGVLSVDRMVVFLSD
jgi:hypothetical protein